MLPAYPPHKEEWAGAVTGMRPYTCTVAAQCVSHELMVRRKRRGSCWQTFRVQVLWVQTGTKPSTWNACWWTVRVQVLYMWVPVLSRWSVSVAYWFIKSHIWTTNNVHLNPECLWQIIHESVNWLQMCIYSEGWTKDADDLSSIALPAPSTCLSPASAPAPSCPPHQILTLQPQWVKANAN